MAKIPYREVVGMGFWPWGLMYLMVGTRPDLATLTHETFQHLTNPGKVHWDALTRTLRYVRGTSTHGICLRGLDGTAASASGNFLKAFCDADFAGFITFLFHNSPISWRS